MFCAFAIIAFSIAYNRAKESGRNGYAWGIIIAIVFICTDFTIPFGIRIFLEIGIEFWDFSEHFVESYSIVISIIGLFASFGTTGLLLRHIKKVPEESFDKPPPPPIFDTKD